MQADFSRRLVSTLRSIYRELRHYDFGPGVSVRNSDTWRYIIQTARRNRITSLQNCLEGSEWSRIAETYLLYTRSSRIYSEMLNQSKQARGGQSLIDIIKSQSKSSSVLFELKRKKSSKSSSDNLSKPRKTKQEKDKGNQNIDDDSNEPK